MAVVRVALDAMGSDRAPHTEVEGAVRAIQELPPGFALTLVGPAAAIEAELGNYPAVDRSRIVVVDAPEVIGMGEKPLEAARGFTHTIR